MFRVPMLQQLDLQSSFNKTFCYYWSYPSSHADLGAAYSVELMFVFNIRGEWKREIFNGTNKSDEIFEAVQQTWTNSHAAATRRQTRSIGRRTRL